MLICMIVESTFAKKIHSRNFDAFEIFIASRCKGMNTPSGSIAASVAAWNDSIDLYCTEHTESKTKSTWTDLGHVNKLQRSIFTAAAAAQCVYAVPLGFRSVAAAIRCVHSFTK